MRESEGRSPQVSRESRIEIDLLAIGKRIGLSMEEMAELTCNDLIDLARSYTGKEEKQKGPREATQADIDAFYGG
ncbi:hypothetical protein ABIE27_004081 [Paenibacillus sp. 4624]|uniref:hypothetical protein n=1 Tax=Paenibacillus sp. 4624 TaxID=3156453 RepID=UPI003D1D680D